MTLVVPGDLSFADLRLSRSAEGVSFDLDTLGRLCAANGIDERQFTKAHENNVAGLIVSWYAAHLANGGAPDPIADDLIREAELEGRGQDHDAGRA